MHTHRMENPDSPLVTVITVTYNSSAYVRDCIESVLAQDYKNIEYIIGDDCSSDETWEIIQSYKDERIITYRNEVNLREYPNRNKAVAMATGKYLIFIDGDDIIYPYGIDLFVDMIQRFPEVALVVQKGYTNNVIYPIVLYSKDLIRNFFFSSRDLLSSSFASNFFNTSILKSMGGLSNNYRSGDDEVRIRLACYYPVLFISGWLSWPRETPGQASSLILREDVIIERIKMTKEICKIISSKDPELSVEILASRKKSLFKIVAKLFLTAKVGMARKIMRVTGLSFYDLIKSACYRVRQVDILKSYNPAKPMKMNWNNE